MATLICSSTNLVLTSGSKIKVIPFRDPSENVVYDLKQKPVEDAEKQNKEKKKTVEETTTGIDPHVSTGRVLATAFSGSGNYFAACTDEKELSLWTTDGSWTKRWTKTVIRRCMALTFDVDDSALFVAEKAGGVYQYSVQDDGKEPSLILGHVSMLLDVVVSPGGKFIATAERDEKIRVSCLPNAYTIHTYCLGHTEFVNRLSFLPGTDHLVSTAGDSTLRLWDYRQGRELCSTSFSWARSGDEDGEKNKATVTCLSCSKQHRLVAVTILDHCSVPVYRISENEGCWSAEEVTRIQCTHPPWSLTFDPNGRLLVLVPDPERSLRVFDVERSSSDTYKVSEVSTTSNDATSFAQHVLDDWEFLQCSCDVKSVYKGLHKVPFDNMPDYLQRKQQRIETTQSKKGRQRQRMKKGKGVKRPNDDDDVADNNGDHSKRTMLDDDVEDDEEEDEEEGDDNDVKEMEDMVVAS